MKAIVLALFLSFVFQGSPPSNGSEQQKPAHSKQKSPAQPQAQSNIPITNNQDCPCKQEKSAKAEAEKRPEKPPRWDVIWPTWGLVIIGFLGVLAAVWTLSIIRRQTDALLNADRPLVLIRWDNFVHINPDAPSGVMSHCFTWSFENTGKSPAFIQTICCRFVTIEKVKDLPTTPRYIHPKDVSSYIEPLLSGQTYKPRSYEVIESGYGYQQLEKMHRGKKCSLYAYGFVQYRDFHGRDHETRFGLVYVSQPTPTLGEDHFHLAGPPAYNRYT